MAEALSEPPADVFDRYDDHPTENEFLSIISGVEDSVAPSTNVFNLIYEWFVSYASSTDAKEIETSHLDLFFMYFKLLRSSPYPTQLEELKKFNKLIQAYGTVRAYCCKRFFIQRILDEVLANMPPNDQNGSVIVELMVTVELLGYFNVHGSDLKSLFRALQRNSPKSQSWQMLMEAMNKMCGVPQGPGVYFDFPGISETGIMLPAIQKLPPNGFTFLTWCRAEFSNSSIPGVCPHLFSFLTSEGLGIELFFKDGELWMHNELKGKKATQRLPFIFHPHTWYFIAVTHEYRFIGTSVVKLYVNSQKFEYPLTYPKISEPLTTCCVGMNAKVNGKFLMGRSHPFMGQMSSFFLFKEPLSDSEVKPIAEIPLKSARRFSPGDVGSAGEKLAPKLLFGYNPMATIGTACFDISAGNKRRKVTQGLMKGIHVMRVMHLRDAIRYIGGVKALFVLFAHKTPAISGVGAIAESELEGSTDDVDAGKITQLLFLLRNVLYDPSNQEDMLQCGGFSILSHLLRQAPPLQSFNKATIAALDSLATAHASNEALEKDLMLRVFLDFRIWIYADVEVQRELLRILTDKVTARTQHFRTMIGVQQLLDVCRSFYWSRPEERSLAVESVIQDSTGRDIGARPSPSIVRDLRHRLLEIVFLMLKENISSEEARALFLYLEHCTDDKQTIDVLKLLMSLQRRANHPVVKLLISFGPNEAAGLDPWIGLLQSESETVRLWALKLIAKIVEQLPQTSARQPLLTRQRASAITKRLQRFAFSEATYHVLLEVLLGSPSFDNFKHPLQVPPPPGTGAGPSRMFKNPHIISTIFEVCCISGSPAQYTQVLTDFRTMLVNFPVNKNIFLDLHWQPWLFGFLARTPSDKLVRPPDSPASLRMSASLPQPGADKSLLGLFSEIVTVLHHHSISQPNGWPTLVQTETMLDYFGEHEFFDAVQLRRSLHSALLASLQADLSLLQTTDIRIWDSLGKWVAIVGDFLFYSAPQGADPTVRIYRDAEGRWIDYYWAQRLTDFTDTLVSRIGPIINPPASPAPQTRAPPSAQRAAPSAPAAPSPMKPEHQPLAKHLENFGKLELNSILTTIHEADRFTAADKPLKELNLQRLSALVSNEKQAVQTAVKHYVEFRVSTHKKASDEAMRIFQKTLGRLKLIVDGLLQKPDLNKGRVLYIVWCLYKAMKASHEVAGVGREPIFRLFCDVIPKLAPQYIELVDFKGQQLVEVFMKGLSFPDEPFVMAARFTAVINGVIDEQTVAIASTAEKKAQNKDIVLGRLSQDAEEDSVTQLQFNEELQAVQSKLTKFEQHRRSTFLGSLEQLAKRTATKWKHVYRTLSSERGAANPLLAGASVRIFWTLSDLENRDRMRKILKRNYKGGDHSEHTNEAAKLRIELQRQRRGSLLTKAESAQADDLAQDVAVAAAVAEDDDEDEKISLEVDCEWIRPMLSQKGVVQLSQTHLYICTDALPGSAPASASQVKNKKQQWQKRLALRDVAAVHGRRYVLRPTALELFMVNRKSYFLNFASHSEAQRMFRKLTGVIGGYTAPPIPTWCVLESNFWPPDKLLSKYNLTQLWVQRKISNFDYLMFLNTVSGRTYNDLAQYPVFPWVLTDYGSDQIPDLNDSSNFRDLSKPIGALESDRLQQFLDRYEAFTDPLIPKFLYGSHYSSPGIALFYLLRLEPFCTHALTLQGGYFDLPERLFDSVGTTWKNCLTNASDVKELIPEFYYLPEFLLNMNNLDLGTKQDGSRMGDVGLPPWARGDPKLFIKVNRDALESDFVSAHLHEWIDLIFGAKQRDADSVDANNVFYYLSYEGAVNLDSIEDANERRSTIDHIQNFGQTPAQLFRRPHPARMSEAAVRSASSGSALPLAPSYAFPPSRVAGETETPVVFLDYTGEQLLMVYSDGIIGISRFLNQPDSMGFPYTLELDRSMNSQKPRELEVAPFGIDSKRLSQYFAVSADGKTLIHAGFFTNSLKLVTAATAQTAFSVSDHGAPITCVQLADDGRTLVTGSADASVRVWDMAVSRSNWMSLKRRGAPLRLKHVLIGHDAEVTCVAVNANCGVIVSASKDETCIQSTLDGKYLRSLRPKGVVELVAISDAGNVFLYSPSQAQLYVHDVNGSVEASVDSLPGVSHLLLTSDSQYLVLAQGAVISIRQAPTWHVVRELDVPANSKSAFDVCSLAFTRDGARERFLIAGLQDARLAVFPFSPSTW
eukprot:TRINITY_DN5106_c0_g1_i2.p1 TRINITY_DN5106_c0_g1~~TRINITY_DN5106_c0_g1_i2.p1  ORF type:complete len:2201 (-),score=900.22 TRINITY_DN5106_c0_g1_i2:184-6786(-)